MQHSQRLPAVRLWQMFLHLSLYEFHKLTPEDNVVGANSNNGIFDKTYLDTGGTSFLKGI